MEDIIINQIKDSCKIKKLILNDTNLISIIKKVSTKAIEIFRSGNKLIIAGNGGSAGDAQHFAGELVNKFYFDRPGLPCIALTTDTSIITAIGNDYSFDDIFARQIQANGNIGDMFIGISTSGNSKNIINAIGECKKKGIVTVGLTGQGEGKIDVMCDYCIKIPSNETPRIQEGHILIEHIICSIIEKEIFSGGN